MADRERINVADVASLRRIPARDVGGGSRSGLFTPSLSQGVIDPILPAGPALLEVFENVLIDPQRNELLHTRKRGLLRRQFRNLCRCLLERGFGFGARIVERPRPSWWL